MSTPFKDNSRITQGLSNTNAYAINGCVKKINLNWMVPSKLGEVFRGYVSARWDAKRMWIGASAAILMYLDATDEEREPYERMANDLSMSSMPGRVKQIIDRADPDKPTDEASKAASIEKAVDRETDALVADTKRLKGQDRKGKRA